MVSEGPAEAYIRKHLYLIQKCLITSILHTHDEIYQGKILYNYVKKCGYFVSLIKKNYFKGVIYPTTSYFAAVIFKRTFILLQYVKKISCIPIPIEIPISRFTSGMTHLDLNSCYVIEFHQKERITSNTQYILIITPYFIQL